VKSRKTLEYYIDGIFKGDRVVLAQAITLAESVLPSDRDLASHLIEKVISKSGNSVRIGITGSPGVGKSTFIEAFGKFLTDLGKKVAILTIDPSSQRSKGSILGDKTRMPELAVNPHAFIRPTSSGNAIGGVAYKTREAILLCEAAGYDITLIETVGVGQSETAVKNLTDFFMLLMLPGSGDELQGIKKGIMEMADLIVITKADGENTSKAKQAQADFQHAVNTLYSYDEGWIPKVLTVSALLRTGLSELYEQISQYVERSRASGSFQALRAKQSVTHMHEHFHLLIKAKLETSDLQKQFQLLEHKVMTQQLLPEEGGRQLLDLFQKHLQGRKS
jgi:LAO/AO transport system kinase